MKHTPTRKHKIIAALVVAGILATGWYFSGSKHKGSGEIPTATVTTGSIEETVTAQGKLEPKEYVDVGAQVSGQLRKVHFEIGDVVKKGQLLAEIDPQVYESKVEADKAKLNALIAQSAQAEAQKTLAQEQYDRNARLIKAEAVSQDELQQTQSALRVAEGSVKSFKAQIAEQQSSLKGDTANLSYTKIYAPMDGTVTSQTIREGQTINSNQQAPVILQIADLDVMTVRAQVAEADVMRLKPDMDVYFTTLGALDKRWKGKLRQILTSPETINDVVLYNALIDVDNKDRQLLTGMSTQIFFVLGKAENVATIPVPALGKHLTAQDDATGQAYNVTVIEDGKQLEKTIRVGLMDRTIAEVKSGLSAGEKVLLPVRSAAPKSGGNGGGGRAMQGMPRI